LAFVITQNCCTDASCIPVCPVDCIRPVPGGNTFGAQMLYIDPKTCVDCGACVAECPVGAIYYEDDLPAAQARFRDINADYFGDVPVRPRNMLAETDIRGVERGALRVAIVGAGPAACYAATELLRTPGVEVSLFDRLPTPFGLIRSGVAPDHQATKAITASFGPVLASERLSCYFNVEVGRDISAEELAASHHAVIYAFGASRSRDLGIAGEQLPGHYAAAEFVGWYNGHPDFAGLSFDLSTPQVVIVGNGNVALDSARILLAGADALSATDIADHALRDLACGSVREVVLLGRRGAAVGAFSAGELLALGQLRNVDVVIEGVLGERPSDDFDGALKYDVITEYAARPQTPGNKRLVLRFNSAPVEFVGSDRVQGLRTSDGVIDTALVLRSIGYRGAPLAGVPFDGELGRIPNDEGRVVNNGAPMPGAYVTGWIKRGPRGVIGTNRSCAAQTVTHVLADFAAGRLPEAAGTDIAAVLRTRGVTAVDWSGWLAIDAAERARGAESARPRAKFVDVAELVGAAQG
jgi:ferredoxin--NADP+ reductase